MFANMQKYSMYIKSVIRTGILTIFAFNTSTMASTTLCYTPPRQQTIIRKDVLCPKKSKVFVSEDLSMLTLMHSDSNVRRSLIDEVMNAEDFKLVITPKKDERKKKVESSSPKQVILKTEVEAENDIFDDAPPTMMRIAIPRSHSSDKISKRKYVFESTGIDGVTIPIKKSKRRRRSKTEIIFYRSL